MSIILSAPTFRHYIGVGFGVTFELPIDIFEISSRIVRVSIDVVLALTSHISENKSEYRRSWWVAGICNNSHESCHDAYVWFTLPQTHTWNVQNVCERSEDVFSSVSTTRFLSVQAERFHSRRKQKKSREWRKVFYQRYILQRTAKTRLELTQRMILKTQIQWMQLIVSILCRCDPVV